MSFPRKRESRATATSLALDPRFRGGDSPREMRRPQAGRVAKLVEIWVTRVSIWQTTRSGSLNKSLLSRGDVKALPAVDLAQRDLTAGHQGPEEHASGGGAGQQALCLDAALELFMQALDGIGGADRAPLLEREAQEGEELLAGFLQTVG